MVAPDTDLGDGGMVQDDKEPVVQTPAVGTHQSEDEGQQERRGDEESTHQERQGGPLIPEFVPPAAPTVRYMTCRMVRPYKARSSMFKWVGIS
jgi:hypothetical protein